MTRLQPRPAPEAPGSAAGPPMPCLDPVESVPVLVLEPHSRCNCRCLMCDIWRDPRRAELEPDEVAGWLPEWLELGVRRVVLTGGEPLLHGRLFELCALLRSAGIGITLLSTGLLLQRNALDVARYVDDLIVSLDGPEPVHDAIRRVPRAYRRLAEGLEAVRAAGGPVRASGRCTVQRANFLHLRATVGAAHRLGLERISFLAADVSTEAFNRPGGWDAARAAEVTLSPDELPQLASELDALEQECAADLASGYVAEPMPKLRRRLYQYFAALAGQGEFARNECNAPWVSAVVEPDGTVRPCFFQPPLGNLHDGRSLAAVMNAPAALAFRRGLDVASDPICRRCVCTLRLRQGEA